MKTTQNTWARRVLAAAAVPATLAGVLIAAQPAAAANQDVHPNRRAGDLTITLKPGATVNDLDFVTSAKAPACPTGFQAGSQTWVAMDTNLLDITHKVRTPGSAPINLTNKADLGGVDRVGPNLFQDKDGKFEYIVTCAATAATANPAADSVRYYSAVINYDANGKLSIANANDQRFAGKDRYETSVLVSREVNRVGKPLVIATGTNFPDALAAGPVAAKLEGTLLLSLQDRITNEVSAEIKRLKPSQVIIVGTEASVNKNAENQIRSAAGSAEIKRIGGKNRFDTAAQLAKTYFPGAKGAFVTTGYNFPDAISAGSVAAMGEGRPVLLTLQNRLPAETADAIKSLGIKEVTTVGAESSVNATAYSQISAINGVKNERVSGKNRYETNVMLMQKFAPKTSEKVVLATGNSYADALVASMFSSRDNAPVVLVAGSCSVQETATYVESLKASAAYRIGQPNTVADTVLATRCPVRR